MYEEYVSLRTLRRFFFSPSTAVVPDVFAAFLVALSDAGVLAGALEAVEGGATAMVNVVGRGSQPDNALITNDRVESRVVAPSYIPHETRVVVFGSAPGRVASLLIGLCINFILSTSAMWV